MVNYSFVRLYTIYMFSANIFSNYYNLLIFRIAIVFINFHSLEQCLRQGFGFVEGRFPGREKSRLPG